MSPTFSTIAPLDSPSYPMPHLSPTTADFGGGFHDEQAGFAAPPSPTTTHIHVPAPCLALPAAQMDDLFVSTAGAGASLMQMHTLPLPPTSIFPSIAPRAFQGRDAASVTLSIPPPNATAHAMYPHPNPLSSAARVAASSRRDAFASSSSLTGWAG
jgi:hypothetical protein